MPKSKIQVVLERFGTNVVSSLEKSLAENKDATGNLRDSIHFQIKLFAGINYNFKLYLADYYKYVDEGRKPGKFPPPEVIQKWIIDKRIKYDTGERGPRGGKKLALLGNDERRKKQVAYLIGRKIAKEGIAPTHFYSNVVNPQLIDNLRKELKEAGLADLRVEVKNLAQELS